MRRRPEVKLLLSPPHILPGMQLRADAVVLAKIVADEALRARVRRLDRLESFAVPIACRPSEALPPARPQLFATSAEGPRGTTPFMEVALETTHVAAGEVSPGRCRSRISADGASKGSRSRSSRPNPSTRTPRRRGRCVATPSACTTSRRERRALVWKQAAESASLVCDRDSERMVGSRAGISIEIRTERREADFWLVAVLIWPSLALAVGVGERRWTDLLSRDLIKTVSSDADGRSAVHAREQAQARAVPGPELLAALLAFEQVAVDDVSATLGSRGTPHVTAPVDAFVALAMRAADAMVEVIKAIPPPALFAPHAAAWCAFAERLRGRLELGRMRLHDAVSGTDSFSVVAEWTRGGAPAGMRVRVAFDPSLDAVPAAAADPATSPAARDTWLALTGHAAAVAVTREAVLVELEGTLADPADAMTVIEPAVSLRRSLACIRAAGPFR